MAGPRVWGGKQEKTPSRFSSNPCLWSGASSLSASPRSLFLFLSAGFPPFFISPCLSLSPCRSSSYLSHLVSLLVSLCLHVSVSLSGSLSPGPSIFQTPPLSASTSVCPSLPVLVHLSVSLRLPARGCLCPSVPPPICLVVCVSPSKGAHSLPKVPSPRSAKASPGSEVGRGCRAAASGSFSSSWAELGVRG